MIGAFAPSPPMRGFGADWRDTPAFLVGGADCSACIDARTRESHHRIKNSLQVVASMLSLQARTADDQPVREALAQASRRVFAVARLHERLQNGGTGAVRSRPFLEQLCADLDLALGCRERGVCIDLVASDSELSEDEASTLGMILNELVANSVKHAFSGSGGGVHVVFESDFGARVLRFADDGPGMALQPQAKAGLGLALIAHFAKKLGASLTIDRLGPGAAVELRFQPDRLAPHQRPADAAGDPV